MIVTVPEAVAPIIVSAMHADDYRVYTVGQPDQMVEIGLYASDPQFQIGALFLQALSKRVLIEYHDKQEEQITNGGSHQRPLTTDSGDNTDDG